MYNILQAGKRQHPTRQNIRNMIISVSIILLFGELQKLENELGNFVGILQKQNCYGRVVTADWNI